MTTQRKEFAIDLNDFNDYNDIIFHFSRDLISIMASITIRNLEDTLKTKLRIQAAHHHHSMEEEARQILRTALTSAASDEQNLASAIRRRFAPLGGIDLQLPSREPNREPPDFTK